MKNLTISKLKKALSGKSENDLLEEIINLFKKIPQVKEYYTLALSEEGEELIFDKYKEIGMEMGFKYVESGALVRSSYKAQRHLV